jgi:hypothetical protein
LEQKYFSVSTALIWDWLNEQRFVLPDFSIMFTISDEPELCASSGKRVSQIFFTRSREVAKKKE